VLIKVNKMETCTYDRIGIIACSLRSTSDFVLNLNMQRNIVYPFDHNYYYYYNKIVLIQYGITERNNNDIM
jgi:hypothetical protein